MYKRLKLYDEISGLLHRVTMWHLAAVVIALVVYAAAIIFDIEWLVTEAGAVFWALYTMFAVTLTLLHAAEKLLIDLTFCNDDDPL